MTWTPEWESGVGLMILIACFITSYSLIISIGILVATVSSTITNVVAILVSTPHTIPPS